MSNYTASMAARSASKKAEGMLQPLLSDDEDASTATSGSSSSSESTEFEKFKPTIMQRVRQAVVNVCLLGGAGGSVAAMVLAPAIMVFIAGGICIANVPYAIYKERELTKIPTLRSLNNKLREDANRLEENVDQLSLEIDILEPEADRAAKVEGQLRDIADKQQVNVNKLVELVKENENVLVEMRQNLRKRIVQDIIATVVRGDKNNDLVIDKNEAKELALQIRLQLQEYDVDFDSEKFLKVVAKYPSVPVVISIIQKLLPSEEKAEVKEERRDVDYSTDSDEDSVDEVEDEYDMFYIGVDRGSIVDGGGRSLLSGGSGVGVSLMKSDRRKSKRYSTASEALLKKRMSRVGTFAS